MAGEEEEEGWKRMRERSEEYVGYGG